MLTIEIFRRQYADTYTEGDLYIRRTEDSNLSWFCTTLEPTWRDISNPAAKVSGRTCIPAGKYQAQYSWSTRFRRKLPRILNVPTFDGILIHAGNDALKDSKGCVLVGIKYRDGYIVNSRFTLERLCTLLLNTGAAGEGFRVVVHDGYDCPNNRNK